MSEYLDRIDIGGKSIKLHYGEPAVYSDDPQAQHIREVFYDRGNCDLRFTLDLITMTEFNIIIDGQNYAPIEEYNGVYMFRIEPLALTMYLYIDKLVTTIEEEILVNYDRAIKLYCNPIIADYIQRKAFDAVNNKLLYNKPLCIYSDLTDKYSRYENKSLGAMDFSYYIRTIKALDCRDVTTMERAFFGKTNFWDVKGIENTENITSFRLAFADCLGLLRFADSPKLNTTACVDFSDMFTNCDSLQYVDFTMFDMSHATDVYTMFGGCKALSNESVVMDLTCAVNAQNMFNNTKIRTITIHNSPNLSNMERMFAGCSDLSEISFVDCSFGNVSNIRYTFSSCASLVHFSGLKDIKKSYSLSNSWRLSYDSAMNCINGLYDLTQGGTITDYTPQTLTFSTATRALLSDEDIAIATAKGWNIAG